MTSPPSIVGVAVERALHADRVEEVDPEGALVGARDLDEVDAVERRGREQRRGAVALNGHGAPCPERASTGRSSDLHVQRLVGLGLDQAVFDAEPQLRLVAGLLDRNDDRLLSSIWPASQRSSERCTSSWVVASSASECGAKTSWRRPQPNSGRSTRSPGDGQQHLADQLRRRGARSRPGGLAGGRVDAEREGVVVALHRSQPADLRSGSTDDHDRALHGAVGGQAQPTLLSVSDESPVRPCSWRAGCPTAPARTDAGWRDRERAAGDGEGVGRPEDAVPSAFVTLLLRGGAVTVPPCGHCIVLAVVRMAGHHVTSSAPSLTLDPAVG